MKFTRKTKILTGLAFAAIYSIPLLTINGNYDLFLKTKGGGIPDGEVTETKETTGFAGWIRIRSFSIGGSNTINIGSIGGGGGAGKAALSSLAISGVADSTSPAFFNAMTTGTQIDELKLFLKNPLQPDSFMKLYLKPAYVESINWSGPGDERPAQSITLTYGAIKIEYELIDDNGKTVTQTTAEWSRTLNKAVYANP